MKNPESYEQIFNESRETVRLFIMKARNQCCKDSMKALLAFMDGAEDFLKENKK